MFCHVSAEQVFGVHDVSSVYHVPLLLQSQGIVEYLRKRLDLNSINITDKMAKHGVTLEKKWRDLTSGYVLMTSFQLLLIVYCRQERLFDSVNIVLVGKYTDLKDSYMSVTKALEHSAFRVHRKLTITVRPVGYQHSNT